MKNGYITSTPRDPNFVNFVTMNPEARKRLQEQKRERKSNRPAK